MLRAERSQRVSEDQVFWFNQLLERSPIFPDPDAPPFGRPLPAPPSCAPGMHACYTPYFAR